jgi:hypothetical protein
MDYYQSVVMDYIRADRATFVNTETCIQLNPGNPDTSGLHWYCDAVVTDFRDRRIFLTEISFSKQLSDLAQRLRGWAANCDGVCAALARDSCLPIEWPVRPWLFVPEDRLPQLCKVLGSTGAEGHFVPRVTTLEMVQPWRYRSWDRVGEAPKPDAVPAEMRD